MWRYGGTAPSSLNPSTERQWLVCFMFRPFRHMKHTSDRWTLCWLSYIRCCAAQVFVIPNWVPATFLTSSCRVSCRAARLLMTRVRLSAADNSAVQRGYVFCSFTSSGRSNGRATEHVEGGGSGPVDTRAIPAVGMWYALS